MRGEFARFGVRRAILSRGLENLRHIVVLMMENRSRFDDMLGAFKQKNASSDGLTGAEWNPDSNGAQLRVARKATYQDQLVTDPDHHFP